MNNGFIPCYPALSGPYNVTVEIVGIGEVEMSDGNIINETNTPQIYSRFGGVALPFEVKNGSFQSWEVLPAGIYVYNPLVDTLELDLQGDVTVIANFIPAVPTRDITYNVSPSGSSTIIDINGTIINTFPTTITYFINDTISLSPGIDPLYGFITWSSDSVNLMPTITNLTDSFYATNHDNVTLHIYKKPTIVYDVIPAGTTTSIDINGVNISVFPFASTYYNNETITLSPIIDPLYHHVSWEYDSITMLNGNSEANSFISEYNDTVKLVLDVIPPLTAVIDGNDTICDNGSVDAQVEIKFNDAVPPVTFIYAIDSISQPAIILSTTINPYIIHTQQAGFYTLQSYIDANNDTGSISGSALVTIQQAPVANFHLNPDAMTILYTTTRMIDESVADTSLVSWHWDFGDNTPADSARNPYHIYKDSIALYQVSLIVSDANGCTDTTFKHLQITDDYWMYIPNSFTPDLDGKNDKFCISYHGVREETFTFNAYNRFSELVYSTNNINSLECPNKENEYLINGWDGKHQVTGNDLPTGTYIYEVYFQDFEGWKHQDRGHVFIVK